MPGKKTQKMDTAIIVAIIGLVGTVVTALIASPLLPGLLDRETNPTEETPSAVNKNIVFSNDFESGDASGFAFNGDQWQVTNDRGQQVLEMTSIPNGGVAVFGPNDFSNGEIRFRLKFMEIGNFLVNFRSEVDTQTYTLYLSPIENNITLGYNNAESDWTFEPFAGDSVRGFQFNEGVWYDVRLDVLGDQMTVWVDDNKLFSSADSRLQTGSMEFNVLDGCTVRIDDVEVSEYSG